MEVDKENSNSNSDSSKMAVISDFKDLRKPTMNETYRNVGTLVKKEEIQDIEKFKEFLLSVSPSSLFDECLMLVGIDSLQFEDGVVKVLLSQNDKQIKRILNCEWFFKGLAFEYCTSELFPHISASLRCKIITRLSKHLENKDEAEKYFTFIRRNYDNQRADYLLPKCSSEFILRHFEKHKSILRHPAELRILSAISKRYPEVGLHILEHIFSVQKNSYELKKYNHILQYLAGNHHDLFVLFLRKHHSQLESETFGRKVTKKFGKKVRDDFLSNVIGAVPFKPKVLFSMLPFEERVKLLAKLLCCNDIRGLSFKTWSYSKYELCKYLKMIKPENRLVYIEGTFKELYNLNFNNNSKYWGSAFLELLPLETRKPFLVKMEKFFSEEESVFERNMDESFCIRSPEEFIYLFDFSTAFEKLKELLRTAPLPSKRMGIICQMVQNCSINSDLKGLEEVVDYVVTRHRNDECKVLYHFIHLISNSFPWTALTHRIFEKLDELFHLCALRNDPPFHIHVQWKEPYLYHIIDSGLDVDTHLKQYFESVILSRPYGSFVVDYNCRHSKTLLLKLCEMALRWIRSTASEDLNNNLFTCIIETCAAFNRANPGSRIWREVTGLEELLLEKLKRKYGEVGGEQWGLDVWKKYYNDITDTNCNPKCLLYVLVRKPDFIKTHLEGIINCLMSIKEYSSHFKTYKNCFNFVVKGASFFEKTERIKELLLKEFKSENSLERKKIALILYSQVSTIEEYSKVVEEYLPKDERVEAHSDMDFGRIQLLIPTLIKNVRPRWRNFDLILKFFMGDFLKRIKPSLHACCHYTRVDVVVPFLKRHLETLPQRVSYQKDIIRIIAELSTRDETIDFCLKFWEKHNHYTIRTILFCFVSKLFAEQPTRDALRALKKCIMEADSTVFTKMPSFEAIPDEFLEEYVDALMRFSEGQPAAFRNDFQSSILSHFHGKKIKVMSSDFSERIIRNHLFNSESGLDVKQFAYFYLAEGPNSVEDRVRTIFDLVSRNKPSPMDVSVFLGMLMQNSMPNLVAFGSLFKAVLDNWPEYPLGILYEKQVKFTYCNLYQKAAERSPDGEFPAAEFAEELRQLYSRVDNLRDVVVIFGEALKNFLGNFKTEKGLSVIKELVTGSKDRNVALVGIWALPKEAVSWFRREDDPLNELARKQRKTMDDLFKVLESYDDTVVEIYLRRKFYGCD